MGVPKAIIWDVDGTLYRQAPLRAAILREFVRKHWNHPWKGLAQARILRAHRRALELMRQPGSGQGSSYSAEAHVELTCRISACGRGAVEECLHRWFEEAPLRLLARCIRPGLADTLRDLRAKGIRQAVFSDYPAQRKLEALGVSSFFDVVCAAGDQEIRALKPHPRGLQIALAQLGLSSPSEALYVGDRQSVDGIAAERAGMRSLIFDKESHAGELFRAIHAN
jgi:HAD superfamily hydrolase (TIGR01509 family)